MAHTPEMEPLTYLASFLPGAPVNFHPGEVVVLALGAVPTAYRAS